MPHDFVKQVIADQVTKIKANFTQQDTSPFYILIGEIIRVYDTPQGQLVDIKYHMYNLWSAGTKEERSMAFARLGKDVALDMIQVYIMSVVIKAYTSKFYAPGMPGQSPQAEENVIILVSTLDYKKYTLVYKVDRSGSQPIMIDKGPQSEIKHNPDTYEFIDEQMTTSFWLAYSQTFQAVVAGHELVKKQGVPLQ